MNGIKINNVDEVPYIIEVPSNHGGTRPGAGREKKPDPKKQVFIGVRESQIKKLGGMEKVKQLLVEYINQVQVPDVDSQVLQVQ